METKTSEQRVIDAETTFLKSLIKAAPDFKIISNEHLIELLLDQLTLEQLRQIQSLM